MILTTKNKHDSSQDLFLSRMYDALETSYRQERAVLTVFLTPAQQDLAEKNLSSAASLYFWGGHEQAERRQLIIFPQEPENEAAARKASDVICLHARVPRNAEPLKHPQVLGAAMGLGIEREQIGDILCTDTDVRLFVREHLAQYIMAELKKAGRSSLKWEWEEDPEIDVPVRETFEAIVSSTRLDAVVAALARCSRSAAEEKIRSGDIKVNDVTVGKNKVLCDNDLVSIRRCGRFRFLKARAQTKKNRLILQFERYL